VAGRAVAWSVCLCVLITTVNTAIRLNQSRCRLGDQGTTVLDGVHTRAWRMRLNDRWLHLASHQQLSGRIACTQHRCGLFLDSVVSIRVCVLVTAVIRAKTTEPIAVPFGTLTHVGPRNHALDMIQLDSYTYRNGTHCETLCQPTVKSSDYAVLWSGCSLRSPAAK